MNTPGRKLPGRFCTVPLLLGLLLVPVGLADAAKPQPINVFPSPGTPVASETTTFSFRGLAPKNLGRIFVHGSRSGRHGGSFLKHSDGRGLSFVPKRRFVRGERVSVFTGKKIRGARNGDFTVRIGRFVGSNMKPSRDVSKNDSPALVSRPDLRPPRLEIRARTEAAAPGSIFFAPKNSGLTIADNRGRITWFRPIDRRLREWVQDFRSQTYKGEPVLTYWSGTSPREANGLRAQSNILDRSYRRIARVVPGNGYLADTHEFKITPRDTALMLSYRSVRWDLRKWGGGRHGLVFDNVVQEVDIGTGAVLFEWHSLGNVGLSATVSRPPEDGSAWDYFHVNSADPDGDSVLISARKVSSIYRLDLATGRVKWRLRGDGLKPGLNDFRVDKNARFGYQHDAVRLPNGDVSLFDNSLAPKFTTVRPQSSGMIVRLSGRRGEKGRARLVKRYDHPRKVESVSQGSAQVLPGGNMMVGWGSRPRISEFTPDGRLAFDATFGSVPVNSYRARKDEWDGRPPGRPAIATKSSGGTGSVWASWNGSGRIARWRVLSGSAADRVEPVATAAWTGLETRIPVPGLGAVTLVEAIDADGETLGRSAPVGRDSRSR